MTCPTPSLHRIARLLLCGLVAAPALWAQALTDGPYVFHAGTHSEARWICASELKAAPIDASGRIAALCGDLPTLTLEKSPALAPDSLPQAPRWAALSDVHGQADLMLRLLRAQGIVDEKDRWLWGNGVLVVVGDTLDRGPQQIEALWTIYRLAQEATSAGGRVELLLGNHEVMVLAGDLRYLHERYLAVAKLLGRSYDQLFAADSELGAWLRRRATVLKLGDTLFVHAGLHPQFADHSIDLAAINTRFRAGLGASRETLSQDPQDDWLLGTDGPTWYRGYFVSERATLEQIEKLLAQAQVSRIVVGHTTMTQIVSLYQGRVIGVDAGIKNGQTGELLIFDKGQLWRGLLDGDRSSLPSGDDLGPQPPAR